MKIEYRIKRLRTDSPEQHLNELGAEGWELVAATSPGSGQWIFKRIIQPKISFNPFVPADIADAVDSRIQSWEFPTDDGNDTR